MTPVLIYRVKTIGYQWCFEYQAHRYHGYRSAEHATQRLYLAFGAQPVLISIGPPR